jgi:hypothetical protein
MRRHLAFLIVAVGTLLAGVLSAQAQQSCSDIELGDAIQRSGELTTLLKIANFRADVKYMGEVAGDLDRFLAGCGSEETGRLAQVCGYDCHLQLGRYSLFMASDLPFLSASGGVSRNDSPLSPQKAQEIAVGGLQTVERGLRYLARQQAGSGGSEDGGYREFVRQLVLLNSLKIQLFMAMGDNWYQTVSEARVKTLDFLLSESLGSTTGSGVASQPNLSKAYTNYEAAMWTLVETKMDIPGETTYDDLRADLFAQERELQDRMDSIRKGFLYIGIDPLQFTTIKFEELERKIKETSAQLESIEARIEGIVREWHANKDGEATRQLDEERMVRGQQVNLMAHQIGKLETQAETFSLAVQEEMNRVDAERDTFAHRQQIRRLEMELATRIAEFENQQQQLQGRKELDLIVLSKEAELDRRSELRWLLSWEMTRMNLDMQLSSIQTQIDEYTRQKDRNANQREQIAIEVTQKHEAIRLSQNAIERSQLQKQQIAARQSDTYMARRKVERESVCQIESQLAFVGASPGQPFTPIDGEQPCNVPPPAFTQIEYNRQMCGDGINIGLREKLNREQVRARAFVLQCVVGDTDFSDLTKMVGSDQIIVNGSSDNPTLPDGVDIQCGNFTQTETDFAKKMWDSELALATAQEDDLEKQRDDLKDHISTIKNWSQNFVGTVQYLQTGLSIAEGILASLNLVPETTVAAAGLASGVYTTIKADKAMTQTVAGLRSALTVALQIGQIQGDIAQKVGQFELQLNAVERDLDNLDVQKAAKALALHRVHFQLAGQRADGLNEVKQMILQNSISDIDCQNQSLGIDERIATLQAEHARLRASMDLSANENALLDFDTQDNDLQIERAHSEIAISERDIERLRLSDEQLEGDTAALDKMIDDARSRIERVREVQGTVTTLADASNQSTNVINELRDRQKQAMLALNDQEMAFVERRIVEQKSNTTAMVADLDHAIELGLKSAGLKEKIRGFQSDIKAQVVKQQEEMTALVSQIDDPQTRRNLFVTSQETLSELMKGVPEYVVSKRRLLTTANLNLHLMRRRYALVAGLTGAQQDWPSTYVRNASQLSTMVSDITDNHFFDERRINIGVAQVVVPANSGFARSIAQNGKVEFELSPAASTEDAMKRLGYLSMWNPTKFQVARNMTLIDAFVGVQFPCTGTQRNAYLLTHEGSGMVFKPLAEGSSELVAQLQVGPERSWVQTFFNLANSQDRVDRIQDFWEDRFQVRQFPPIPGPPNDSNSNLPYLGAPVIGSYSLQVLPSTCSYDGAVYTLYFVYSFGLGSN